MTTFSRRQLIDRDYNPLEGPEELALREAPRAQRGAPPALSPQGAPSVPSGMRCEG